MFKLIFAIIVLYFNFTCYANINIYDRQKAVNYAISHCDSASYNPNYPRTLDNDCTNFVSQVLRYGGIPKSAKWWCSSNDRCWPGKIPYPITCDKNREFIFTKTWTVVDKLYNCLIENQLARLEELQVGDVIQYRKSNWGHSTVVKVKSSTNPILVYYTRDVCNGNHLDVLSSFKGYRALCINDVSSLPFTSFINIQ